MKAMEKDWYKKIWTLDIQNQSWVEDTKRQVDFLVEKLELRGDERILDLACGFGRHSLELARRGYDVTGVDITAQYIEYATKQAQNEKLNAKFICSDVRKVPFNNEFDVVINMADGAIGYLENDEENKKDFCGGFQGFEKWRKTFYGHNEWQLCRDAFSMQVMGCRGKGINAI